MDRDQRRQKRALEIMRMVINETVKVLYVVKQAQKKQLEQQMLHEQQMLVPHVQLLQELREAIKNFLVKAMSELREYMKEFQVVKQVLNTTHTIPQCYLIKEVQEQIQTRLRQCVKQLPEIVLPELVLLVKEEEKKKFINGFLNDVQSLHTQMQTEMQKMQKKLEEKQKELERKQEKIEQEESQSIKKDIIGIIQEQIKVVQRQAKMAQRRQWDEYYMKIACLAAQRSKDPSTPVS